MCFLPAVYPLLFLQQSPPKSNEGSTESNKENAATESGSESSSQEATPEKGEKRNMILGMVVNPCLNVLLVYKTLCCLYCVL